MVSIVSQVNLLRIERSLNEIISAFDPPFRCRIESGIQFEVVAPRSHQIDSERHFLLAVHRFANKTVDHSFVVYEVRRIAHGQHAGLLYQFERVRPTLFHVRTDEQKMTARDFFLRSGEDFDEQLSTYQVRLAGLDTNHLANSELPKDSLHRQFACASFAIINFLKRISAEDANNEGRFLISKRIPWPLRILRQFIEVTREQLRMRARPHDFVLTGLKRKRQQQRHEDAI